MLISFLRLLTHSRIHMSHMSHITNMIRPRPALPIVVIVGATGSGKSKLAIELALRFGGEVINADSMQVYEGLDIITNKVTPAEASTVPHHLLSFTSAHSQYTVVDYQRHALTLIHNILGRGKVPVVVGGTYYYIESLLWHDHIIATPDGGTSSHKRDAEFPDMPVYTEPLASGVNVRARGDLYKLDSLTLHHRLREIDPDSAAKIHPNNKRKIIRSLEVCAQHGETQTQVFAGQRRKLRFDNVCVLWVRCEAGVLRERLDARVEAMIERGLVEEMREFYEHVDRHREEPDYTQGIFQCIGFKEFQRYLHNTDGDKDAELLGEGVELMKISTRQYAKKQVQWIRQRFLKHFYTETPKTYSLDGTDLSRWDEEVRERAEGIVGSYVRGEEVPVEALAVAEYDPGNRSEEHYCEVCARHIYNKRQYEIHLKSRPHEKRLRKMKRKKEVQREEASSVS